jgi:hypothetical protein
VDVLSRAWRFKSSPAHKSEAFVQKRSDVITSFLRRGLESRSATARGGVAGFFSRKKPVTKSFHCEALGKKEVMLSLLF